MRDDKERLHSHSQTCIWQREFGELSLQCEGALTLLKSPDIKMHFLSTVLYIFLMELVGRIFSNIKTFYPSLAIFSVFLVNCL